MQSHAGTARAIGIVVAAALMSGCTGTTPASALDGSSPSAALPTTAPTTLATSSPTPIPSTSVAPTPSATPAPAAWTISPLPDSMAGGVGIAWSADGAKTYLHAVVATLEEAWTHGEDASLYVRSANGGRTWTQDLMLGGGAPSVAATEAHVFVVYSSYECRNGLGLVRSPRHGANETWTSTTCLTRSGDGWTPVALAASGRSVYIAFADDDEGSVRALISRDNGATFARTDVAETDQPGGWGPVAVAASGDLLAVAWGSDTVTRVRTSTDGGRHWAQTSTLSNSAGRLWLAVRDGRISVGGTGPEGDWLQVRDGGDQWLPVALPPRAAYAGLAPSGAIVSLTTPTSCIDSDDVMEAPTGTEQWLRSADGGTSWQVEGALNTCAEFEGAAWIRDKTPVVVALDGDAYIVAMALR